MISAVVLGPLALAAVWAGGGVFLALVLLAAAIMGWEWGRLVGRGRLGPAGAATIATGLVATGLLGAGAGLGAALLAAALGALLVLAAAVLTAQPEPLWAAAGTFWLNLGTQAFLALGQLTENGRTTILWLLAVVWANDIAAYACGRTIGGPRLAPRLSPNKTWAGFAGGVACAALVGLAGGKGAWLAALLGALLGVAAQLGDLAESLAKRHFGVKDSSALIPGHGGLLDRIDGLLAAALVGGLVAWASGGQGGW